ncbi:MAG: hypothetical protein EZS28_040520 [Streblomastix strix]|uniref:Uncharacterized protein n=1 Tax=Streblomastix strix TaxID=222440 RepID=A0A5J4U133_9EUKA|nr:MAG: hypothetical protein EZS28_040520 [Streblomastix strix]
MIPSSPNTNACLLNGYNSSGKLSSRQGISLEQVNRANALRSKTIPNVYIKNFKTKLTSISLSISQKTFPIYYYKTNFCTVFFIMKTHMQLLNQHSLLLQSITHSRKSQCFSLRKDQAMSIQKKCYKASHVLVKAMVSIDAYV